MHAFAKEIDYIRRPQFVNWLLVTWTINSNIISMTTMVTSDANSVMRAVQQMRLISSAEKISKPYGTTSSSIVGIHS